MKILLREAFHERDGVGKRWWKLQRPRRGVSSFVTRLQVGIVGSIVELLFDVAGCKLANPAVHRNLL
ncbi:unnamed protein product [Calypogeia fissa]